MIKQQFKKGPFWLICSIDSKGDVDDFKLIAYPVSIDTPTPSHKNIWNMCKDKINKPWNFYPRGRVEIRNNKAIIFANPYCFEYKNLDENLRESFNLGDLQIEYKTDNSNHYSHEVFKDKY